MSMDETGLRKDGLNAWVWAFGTPKYVVYEVDRSRSKAVPEKTMNDFGGVAVVDGYPGYNDFSRQRCWDHLKREVEETEIEEAIAKFHELYRRAKERRKNLHRSERSSFRRRKIANSPLSSRL